MDAVPLTLQDGPLTLIVRTTGTGGQPHTVRIIAPRREGRNPIYYERKVADDTININLPVHPKKVILTTEEGRVKDVLQGPLTAPQIPYFDAPTRKAPYEPEDIVYEPKWDMESPARIFSNKPLIQYNPDKINKLPEPIKRFIFMHELAHLYFGKELPLKEREMKCDTWAAITFLNQGWNLSSAIYALTQVLNRNKVNVARMLKQRDLIRYLSDNYYG